MVREGSFSFNRKETRAYLIRDLQMECDCTLLEMSVKNLHVNTKINNIKKYST